MSTIDNKSLIDKMIASDGYYEDDPRIHMIVEYLNAYGNITWGVTWSSESPNRRERYLVITQYVRRPRIIWSAASGTH